MSAGHLPQSSSSSRFTVLSCRRRGDHPSAPARLGATGQGLEWSAGADDRLNAGIGPAANSNNNVRGDMPFDEPFGARLQRSLQLAVFLLGPQRCRERARQSSRSFKKNFMSPVFARKKDPKACATGPSLVLMVASGELLFRC
jgi:hypothetical protein